MPTKKPNATVQTVARAAGVSAQTVSRVLTGNGQVSDATRARVAAAIESQGYRRNALGRSLRATRAPLVGLAVADIGNPFYARLHRALEHRLRPASLSLVLMNCDDDAGVERQQLDVLSSYRPSGLVVVPAADSTVGRDDVEAFQHVVTVSRVLPGLTVPSVVTDESRSVAAAVEELVTAGHRTVAAVLGSPGISTTRARERGLTQGLAAHDGCRGVVRYTDGTREQGQRATLDLLAADPTITAVIGFNSPVTEGVFAALRERGLRCPDDVSVVGFTDVGWMALHEPAVTVIAQPVEEMGDLAARLLLGLIDGTVVEPGPHVVASTLIRRGSVAAPRPEEHP